MRKWFFTFLIFNLLLIGCQSQEPKTEARLFGNLYIRYLEDGQEIKAEVTLFTGDSMPVAQAYEPTGGLQFMGSAMRSRSFNEQLIRYQYENRMEAPQEYWFKFNGPNGQEIRIADPIYPVDYFTITDPLSISQGGFLTITPDRVTDHQQIVILLSNEEGLARSLELNGPLQAAEFAIPKKELAALSPGQWEYYIVKKNYSRPSEGLQLLTEYYTKPQTITIVD